MARLCWLHMGFPALCILSRFLESLNKAEVEIVFREGLGSLEVIVPVYV